MTAMTLLDRQAISQAAQRHGVARLRVFGSALTDRFDPDRSDVDFLVDFLPGRADRFEDYFGLLEELQRIAGRDVDLVVAEAIRNPYFRASAVEGAEEIYAC